MRAAAIFAVAILAGCATVPEPKRELPLRPAAFDDQPRALSAREEQVCRLAEIRQQQGLIRDIRSICRKAEWNFWGWTFLQKWVRRLYNSLFNRDGNQDGWFR
jgi:hypothetical protein